mgnify:CR=1 FL=1
MSEVKIYTHPVPGVMESHNRREVLQKLAEKIPKWKPSRNELDKGKINLDNIIKILDYLGKNTRYLDVGKEVTKNLCNACGIPLEKHQYQYNIFCRKHLWKILKTVEKIDSRGR